MKKIAVRIIVLIACAVFVLYRGRTDANGGHHDYNNVSGLGNYHYHHGYPAHLHEGGVCPYNFDDKTGARSGGSSGKSDTKDGEKKKPAAPEPTKNLLGNCLYITQDYICSLEASPHCSLLLSLAPFFTLHRLFRQLR